MLVSHIYVQTVVAGKPHTVRVEPVKVVQGHRWWMLILNNCIPRFEAFKVVGFDPESGNFFFKSRSNGTVIYRSAEDLEVNMFFLPMDYTGGKGQKV